jgi:S-(hydroxymethyl)glutathione dehydrogenase/alcohol dehydrogenase
MKMKAAVLHKTNDPLIIEELETPELERGQVLVKVIVSGVCRSQINEIKAHKGPDKYLPHTLGHEAAGFVEETGPGVTKVKKGDYVVLTWIKGDGLEAKGCIYTRVKDGLKINSGQVTTFSQYTVASENRLVKMPENIPPEIVALFGCVIPTGVGIVKNELKVKKGESIAIFGVGGIGSCVLLGAVAEGANPIIAVDVNPEKLRLAKENGATHTINPVQEDAVAKIKEITGAKGADYAVDASGKIQVIEAAFECINDKGIMIIAGNPAQGEKIHITPFDLIKGKRIMGSWGGATHPDRDIPIFLKDYLEGKLKIERLKRQSYSLNQINDAIRELEQGEVIRVLVWME